MNDVYLNSSKLYLRRTVPTNKFELKIKAEFIRDRNQQRLAEESLAMKKLHKRKNSKKCNLDHRVRYMR